jgi:hypothetical protein
MDTLKNTFIKVIFLFILLNSINAQTFDTIIVKMYKSDTSTQPYDTFFYVKKRKTNKSIYKVNTPMQGEQTINPQVIDGKIPHWVVQTEALKLGETLRQFLQRKWERIINVHGEGIIEGFYLYEVQPVGEIVGNPKEGAMMVRYDYIKKDE